MRNDLSIIVNVHVKIRDINKTLVQKRPADPFIRRTREEIKCSLFCSRLQGKNDAVRLNLPSRTDIMSLIFHIDCGCRVLNREAGGRSHETADVYSKMGQMLWDSNC